MAVKTTEELLGSIRTRLGEDTSDEAIAFIEDVSDTLSDLTSKATDTTNWKEKYEQNDAEWRQKYTDRFFNTEGKEEPEPEPEPEPKTPMSFEDLFK